MFVTPPRFKSLCSLSVWAELQGINWCRLPEMDSDSAFWQTEYRSQIGLLFYPLGGGGCVTNKQNSDVGWGWVVVGENPRRKLSCWKAQNFERTQWSWFEENCLKFPSWIPSDIFYFHNVFTEENCRGYGRAFADARTGITFQASCCFRARCINRALFALSSTDVTSLFIRTTPAVKTGHR